MVTVTDKWGIASIVRDDLEVDVGEVVLAMVLWFDMRISMPGPATWARANTALNSWLTRNDWTRVSKGKWKR